MKEFTASTKSGIKVNVTGHAVKKVATKKEALWVVSLSAEEAHQELGITLPANQKEALVVIDDQKCYETFVRKQERARYEAEQAAKLATLEGQREALADAEYNLYSAEHFPGSKAWNKWNDALKALKAFDEAHPEIKANIKNVDDGFIHTEGSVDL